MRKNHEDINLSHIVYPLMGLMTILWALNNSEDLANPTLNNFYMDVSRLSGLWGSLLLLLQVFFMSRLPLIEQNLSKDKIVKLHKNLGISSLIFISFHIITVLMGNFSNFNELVRGFSNYIFTSNGLLMGVGGTLLILIVALTSIPKRIMKSLKYETWWFLHLYSYMGIFMALPHQFFLGKDMLNTPAAKWFLLLLWGLTIAVLLSYRVILPLYSSFTHQLSVQSVISLGNGYFLMRIQGKHLEKLSIRPGQFLNLRFLTSATWGAINPFSIGSALRGGSFEIMFKVVGDHTQAMSQMKAGTKIFFEGPYGNLYREIEDANVLVLLGAGTGMAPLRSIMESESFKKKTIAFHRMTKADYQISSTMGNYNPLNESFYHVLEGARDKTRVWLPEAIAKENRSLITLTTLTEEEFNEASFYLCGPEAWVKNLKDDLLSSNINPKRIHSEVFAW